MKIAIYGGSFNPPHIGHIKAAKKAEKMLKVDKFFVIPSASSPHKKEVENSPNLCEKFELCKAAFSELDFAKVLDLELARGGETYTIDTLRELKEKYKKDDLFLLIGTDMFASFEKWREFEEIFKLVTLAVFPRCDGDLDLIYKLKKEYQEKYSAKIKVLEIEPFEISSTELREKLKNREGLKFLAPKEYELIIKNRYYGAKPDFSWLREKGHSHLHPKRIPHVKGCEEEAIRLAKLFGGNVEDCAEAAILHDITKVLNREEQLKLVEKYDIMIDDDEKCNHKLLHAKTGAAYAKDRFGVNDEVYKAIFNHTTGCVGMSLIEKIIYMADYIEPTRHFDGVEKLRKITYKSLDEGVIAGLQMSIDDLKDRGIVPHENSIKTLEWFVEQKEKNK